VLGRNGVGKSTLLLTIMGYTNVGRGHLQWRGVDITREPPHRRARAGIGWVAQEREIFSTLTVEENLTLAIRGNAPRKWSLLGAGAPTSEERRALEEILATCGMADRRSLRVNGMSYGEQRQLELAIALASRPRVLLLDEPAAGLSPAERVTMARIVRELPDDLTVVLIEHDMDLALDLADRVTCLHYGQVLVEGTPEEIRRNEKVQEVYLGRPREPAGRAVSASPSEGGGEGGGPARDR